MRRARSIATLALLCFASLSWAQPSGEPISIGERFEIRSEVLGEQREIRIAKPSGYGEGDERYPVVYLLDGGPNNFRHVAGITGFLHWFADRTPGLLLVAIQNTNRNRDLTPPTQSESELRLFPEHGGADRFLEFIVTELRPWVRQNYRTRPYSILIGHSLGGLFAIHALTTQPEAFNGYIAVDPSLQWNDQALVGKFERFVDETPRLDADLFVTMTPGSGVSGVAVGAGKKLEGILTAKAPRGMRWTFRDMPGETHRSTLHPSIYLGLDTIFDGWHLADPYALFEKGGVAALHKHFKEGGERYGYERTTSPFTISIVVADLMSNERLEEAGSVLLHDRDRYPPPWNQLDALGRAYLERGEHTQAARYFKLSLEQNPENELARVKLREIDANGTP